MPVGSPATCTATIPSTSSGWDGALYPWALSIHDFEPLVGTIHQPPPIHQTFEGPGFVVCSFTPRRFDQHPDAVKVPYHHANVDSDEVLFYSDGDFMSRAGSGIGVGSMSFHPAGFVHGPQPGSLERSLDQERTDELAVMVDTFRRLRVTGAGPLGQRAGLPPVLGPLSTDPRRADGATCATLSNVADPLVSGREAFARHLGGGVPGASGRTPWRPRRPTISNGWPSLLT